MYYENLDNSEEINDESDHEAADGLLGYYTRSKRRRGNQHGVERAPSHTDFSERKRKNPIMFVPLEILQAVFKHISHHELSQSVRLVNHRFKIVAEDLLNRSFRKIEKSLILFTKATEISLGYTQDDMEIKCFLKLLNLLEVLKTQHSIVISTIWRYVFNDYYKTKRTCMYGGLLIDAHQAFLWKFIHNPQTLSSPPSVMREYVLPPDLADIVQMSKIFCVHFDRINEESMPDCLICSGCKMVDIVDSACFAPKVVAVERATKDTFTAEYSYFFRNAWFVALPVVSAGKETSWGQRQRMMHMRLRRVVLAHNEMFLQQSQYERELMLRPNPLTPVKKPGNNVYTGYGDIGDIFFYYGAMNEGAYLEKFGMGEGNIEEDGDEEVSDHEDNERNLNVVAGNSEENIFYRIPYLGLRMKIEIKCPLSYAPIKFLESMEAEKKEKLRVKHRTKGETQLRVVFECEGASYARLPAYYVYDFKPRQV